MPVNRVGNNDAAGAAEARAQRRAQDQARAEQARAQRRQDADRAADRNNAAAGVDVQA